MEGAAQKSLDEEVKSNDESVTELNVQKTKTEEEDVEHMKSETTSTSTLKKNNKAHISEDNKEPTSTNVTQNERNVYIYDKDIVDSAESSTLVSQFNEQENTSSRTNENGMIDLIKISLYDF